MKRTLCLLATACTLAPLLLSCKPKIPSVADIRDSRFLDRRIEETPRQKVVRECKQEGERFRVSCTHCHATALEAEIASPDRLQLTDVGKRARIMRRSATFGLHKQCTECHQSKFTLNLNAKRLFGPGGERRKEIEKALGGSSLK